MRNAKCRVPSACPEGTRTAKCLVCMALWPNWVRFALKGSHGEPGYWRRATGYRFLAAAGRNWLRFAPRAFAGNWLRFASHTGYFAVPMCTGTEPAELLYLPAENGFVLSFWAPGPDLPRGGAGGAPREATTWLRLRRKPWHRPQTTAPAANHGTGRNPRHRPPQTTAPGTQVENLCHHALARSLYASAAREWIDLRIAARV